MINDTKLLSTVITKGIKLEHKLVGEQHHSANEDNPQTLWEAYKNKITSMARKRVQAITARLDSKINSLKKT